jgi:hypothetical protein
MFLNTFRPQQSGRRQLAFVPLHHSFIWQLPSENVQGASNRDMDVPSPSFAHKFQIILQMCIKIVE